MRPFVAVRDVFVIAAIILVVLAGYHCISWWWMAVLCGVYGAILAMGAFFIRWNFFIPARHHGDRSSKQICLTFDDGPAEYTELILDILMVDRVRAAFFIIGDRAEASPSVVQRMHDEGHVIGNHSYAHSIHFDWKNRTKMIAEISRTNEVIRAITGRTPKFFRPPFGVTNPELSHAVTLTGMHTIGWSLRSFDTTEKDRHRLLKKLLRQIKGGDVILLHDSEACTEKMLIAFIHTCRERGYTFVRPDEMLGLDAYA